jgi:hypothetical protein
MEELIILRYINIILPIIGSIICYIFYRKYKQPIYLAAVPWLLNVIAYSIFRLFTGSNIEYYFFVTTWSGIIRIYAVVLLIAAIIFLPPIRK